MSRRGENIFKRHDGRWEARYIHHYEDGKAKYRYIYAKTYSEVKAKRNAELLRTDNISPKNSYKSNTFEVLAEDWLSANKNLVKESTYTRYYRIVHSYLYPKFVNYSVNMLDTSAVNSAVNEWLKYGGPKGNPLSSKTVSDILCVLKAIFKFGGKNHYPCLSIDSVRFPAVKKKRIEVLTNEDLKIAERELFKSTGNTEFGFLLALYTGIRIGELCGLKWGDIDMKSRIIHIRRAVERIADLDPGTAKKTKIVINEPKTTSSFRDIPLSSFLYDKLLQFGNNIDADSFLIGNNKICKEPHWVYMNFKRFIKKHHISDYTFHALRHTFATRCIEAGFDSKSLSEILGHASITTTLAIYVHPSLEQKRKQLERLIPCSI